jgi:hypothetical protein
LFRGRDAIGNKERAKPSAADVSDILQIDDDRTAERAPSSLTRDQGFRTSYLLSDGRREAAANCALASSSVAARPSVLTL